MKQIIASMFVKNNMKQIKASVFSENNMKQIITSVLFLPSRQVWG